MYRSESVPNAAAGAAAGSASKHAKKRLASRAGAAADGDCEYTGTTRVDDPVAYYEISDGDDGAPCAVIARLPGAPAPAPPAPAPLLGVPLRGNLDDVLPASAEQNTLFDNVDDPVQLRAAVAFYRKNGYVIVRIATAEMIDNLVYQIFSSILYGHHYKPGLEMILKDKAGNVVTPDMRARFIELCKDPGTFEVGSENLKNARACFGPHLDFGAPMPAGSVQADALWAIRESALLYALASTILECKTLWTDLNRQFLCLPGSGTAQFAHKDGPQFDKADALYLAQNVGTKKKKKTLSAIDKSRMCGKFFALLGYFLCFPGSHKKEFANRVYDLYIESGLYQFSVGMGIFTLDPKKRDPLGIFDGMRKMEVPAGYLLAWDGKLWHAKGKQKRICAGMYIGMFPAGSHPAYAARCGVDELADRQRSRLDGLFPLLWQSGEQTSFKHSGMPFKFGNFPKHMKAYHDKLVDYDDAAFGVGVRNPAKTLRLSIARTKRKQIASKEDGNADWAKEQYFEESVSFVTPRGYKPPQLSVLGEKLDGQRAW